MFSKSSPPFSTLPYPKCTFSVLGNQHTTFPSQNQGKAPYYFKTISLLCILGKMYERIIPNKIKQHALKVTPHIQFGFVPHRSTTLQLMRLTNYI